MKRKRQDDDDAPKPPTHHALTWRDRILRRKARIARERKTRTRAIEQMRAEREAGRILRGNDGDV